MKINICIHQTVNMKQYKFEVNYNYKYKYK